MSVENKRIRPYKLLQNGKILTGTPFRFESIPDVAWLTRRVLGGALVLPTKVFDGSVNKDVSIKPCKTTVRCNAQYVYIGFSRRKIPRSSAYILKRVWNYLQTWTNVRLEYTTANNCVTTCLEATTVRVTQALRWTTTPELAAVRTEQFSNTRIHVTVVFTDAVNTSVCVHLSAVISI